MESGMDASEGSERQSVRRHEKVAALFRDARALPVDARPAWLEEAADGDGEIISEVLELLGFDAASSNPEGDRPRGLTPRIPEHAGPFLLGEVLGQGGAGVVVRARQEDPGRDVAVKLLLGARAQDELWRRFEREAEVLARMTHPGIATVIATGTDTSEPSPVPWIAMELVDGLPIHRHAEEHALDLEARLRLVLEVCRAVAHAHRQGIIHRDLKPDNVLVDREGRVRVLDFGIAHLESGEGDPTTLATEKGQILGTLGFMSPEQARGDAHAIDTSTDVFGLGAVAFHLITGELPHDLEAMSVTARLRAVIEETPRPARQVMPGIPRDLDLILAQALATDPARRYVGAAALADDLERFLERRPVLARAPSLAYQASRFVARNRGLTAGVSLALIVLLVSVPVILHQSAERARNAAVAREEARAWQALSGSFITLFEATRYGGTITPETTLAEFLGKSALAFEDSLNEAPQVRHRLANALGVAHLRVGLLDRAGEILDLARSDLEAMSDAPARSSALNWFALGSLPSRAPTHEDRVRFFERALEAAPDDPDLTPRILEGLAQEFGVRHDWERFDRYASRLEKYELPPALSVGLTLIRVQRALVEGELEQAKEHLVAMEGYAEEADLAACHITTAHAKMLVAKKEGDGDRVLSIGEAALDRFDADVERHPHFLPLLETLEELHGMAGAYEPLGRILQLKLAAQAARALPIEARTGAFQNLTRVLAVQGRGDDALSVCREGIEQATKEGSSEVLELRWTLAETLAGLRKPAEALATLDDLRGDLKRHPEPLVEARVAIMRGWALIASGGDADEAIATMVEGHRLAREIPEGGQQIAELARRQLRGALRSMGRESEFEKLIADK